MNISGGTLRDRVVRSTALVTAVAMAAMVLTVMLVISAIAHNTAETRVDDQMAAVTATLAVGKDGVITELTTPDDSIDDSTWVFDANGVQLEGPRVSDRVQGQADALSGVTARTMVEKNDRLYLAEPVRVRGTGSPRAVVVVSLSLRPYEETRTSVLIGLTGVALLVVLGSAALAAWTLRRALAPVESMAARAEDWSEHDLEARFAVGDAEDEIARLGSTLNLLLDRVAGALQSEQRLTAELAHELRTPLTAIRGEAELAQMSAADPMTTERLGRIVELVDRMTTVITTLVDLARGHADTLTRSPLEDAVAAAVAHQPVDETISVSVVCPPGVVVAAPSDVVVRALAPLFDNATHFAASAVTITVAAHPRTAVISVTDDGPGLEERAIRSLFTAGARGEASDGAGLGLALSRRVARTLGGDVELTSAAGPTTFTLTIPRF